MKRSPKREWTKVFGVILFLMLFGSLSVVGGNPSGISRKVPGIVVDHIPASTKTFIGSPSLCVLPNGDYIASHDLFGPASTEHTQAVTQLFRSTNRGRSWSQLSEIRGQFWSNLFFHRGALYIMGTWKHHGNLIIRRSDDGGITWSEPTDGEHGLLLEGEYHTAPMPMIIHQGRIWRAVENAKSPIEKWGIRYSAMVVSAPVESDLLKASSWTASNYLPHNPAYLDGQFGGWLEGNVVVTPEGKVVDMLRVACYEKGREMAALVQISQDGRTASFDPANGFFDFAGGAKKFSIRYDTVSHRYWTISNFTKEEYRSRDAGRVRNTLVLKSSADLRHWTVHKILLFHPEPEKHGFQYVDWLFNGRDMLYLCRTAYDDKQGGADNFHNANFLTFHRIKNFRRLIDKNIKANDEKSD